MEQELASFSEVDKAGL